MYVTSCCIHFECIKRLVIIGGKFRFEVVIKLVINQEAILARAVGIKFLTYIKIANLFI